MGSLWSSETCIALGIKERRALTPSAKRVYNTVPIQTWSPPRSNSSSCWTTPKNLWSQRPPSITLTKATPRSPSGSSLIAMKLRTTSWKHGKCSKMKSIILLWELPGREKSKIRCLKAHGWCLRLSQMQESSMKEQGSIERPSKRGTVAGTCHLQRLRICSSSSMKRSSTHWIGQTILKIHCILDQRQPSVKAWAMRKKIGYR